MFLSIIVKAIYSLERLEWKVGGRGGGSILNPDVAQFYPRRHLYPISPASHLRHHISFYLIIIVYIMMISKYEKELIYINVGKREGFLYEQKVDSCRLSEIK